MDAIAEGGPAFPHLGLYPGADGNLHPTTTQHCGMSLRDWFAGQAMQSIILADGIQFASNERVRAELAYRQADAMLKARQP